MSLFLNESGSWKHNIDGPWQIELCGTAHLQCMSHESPANW
jgi:hypothetical protein